VRRWIANHRSRGRNEFVDDGPDTWGGWQWICTKNNIPSLKPDADNEMYRFVMHRRQHDAKGKPYSQRSAQIAKKSNNWHQQWMLLLFATRILLYKTEFYDVFQISHSTVASFIVVHFNYLHNWMQNTFLECVVGGDLTLAIHPRMFKTYRI
jgi:hypothetical protein